jgi:hypothetical protein
VMNSGTKTWDTTYHATKIDGQYGPDTIELASVVAPGSNTDITGDFTAPASSGTYKATYQMDGPNGLFGDPFWVEIVVQ